MSFVLKRIGLLAALYYFLLNLLVTALSIITEKPKKIVLQYLQRPLTRNRLPVPSAPRWDRYPYLSEVLR